jgi:biopolymer transport protein ExbB/TolQ
VTPTHKIEGLDAAKGASERSAVAVHGQMKRGLSSLASIAVTAPLVGIFGTLLGIVTSFRGVSGDKYSNLANTAEWLSESLAPTAFGLLVAMVAYCGHKYFSARLDDCDVEMRNASLQPLNELASARF